MPRFFNGNIFKAFFGSKTGFYINAIEIADEADEWIRIVPVGDFPNHHNGAHRITQKHLKQMAANFSTSGTDLLFDIDHGSLGGPTRAAGWSTEIEAREDGLYAKYPDFTPSASQAIEDREYRYFSPVYSLNKENKQGDEIGAIIDSVAITNRPYMDIEIDSIGNRQDFNQNSKKDDMKLSDEVMKKLDLADDAGEDDINEALLDAFLNKEPEDGGPETDDDPETGHEPDDEDLDDDLHAKFNSLQKRLDEKEAAEADMKAVTFINSAVEQGKINPADKPAWMAAAKADFKQTKEALDERKANSAMPGKVSVDEDAGADDKKKINQNEVCAEYLRGQMEISKTGS